LHLEEQIVFGTFAERPVQEHQLDAAVLQLIHEQRLIGITSRQAIRRMDIEPIDGAGGGLVAQALQRRANQRAAAVAIVDEAQLFVQRQPFFAHARTQRLDLAGDGVLLSLFLR